MEINFIHTKKSTFNILCTFLFCISLHFTSNSQEPNIALISVAVEWDLTLTAREGSASKTFVAETKHN